MADVKISGLPASAGLAAADLFAVVDDPSGSPVTQKATMAQMQDFIEAQANVFTANQTIEGASFSEAMLILRRTDGGTNAKNFFVRNGDSFFLLGAANDALTTESIGLSISRSSANVNGVSFGNSTSNPVFNFLGTGTFSIAPLLVQINNAAPRLAFYNTAGGVDYKYWDISLDPDEFRIRTRTDADGAGQTFFDAQRVGTSVTYIQLGASGASRLEMSASQGHQFFNNGGSVALVISAGPGNTSHAFAICDISTTYSTPTTGFSTGISDNLSTHIFTPAGTLATGTITMPATPRDGQIVRISSTQTITTLTVNASGGGTILNAPTTLVAGIGFGYIYRTSTTTWYRLY